MPLKIQITHWSSLPEIAYKSIIGHRREQTHNGRRDQGRQDHQAGVKMATFAWESDVK